VQTVSTRLLLRGEGPRGRGLGTRLGARLTQSNVQLGNEYSTQQLGSLVPRLAHESLGMRCPATHFVVTRKQETVIKFTLA